MDEKKILKEYREYLESDPGIATNSIDSYCKGIEKVNNEFVKKYYKKFYDGNLLAWFACLNKNDRVKLVDLILQKLDIELYQNKINKINNKTMSNLRSYISKFRDYIYTTSFKGKEILVTGIKIPNEYYLNTLKDNFRLRLNTQDRIYNKERIYFPTEIFASKFKSKKEYQIAQNKLIENVKFILSKDGKMVKKLKSIRGIKLNGHNAFIITTKGNLERIYTKIYENGEFKGIEPLKVGKEDNIGKELSDLSLDHVSSVKTILNKNFEKYHQLKKLSYYYFENKKEFKNKYENIGINWDDLLNEVIDIYDKMDIEIMQRGYNSSKSDSI